MTTDKGQQSIKQTIFWLSSGTLLYYIAQWLLTILVVRLGNTSIAGDYALALSSSNIFYSLALFGMRNYQISDIKKEHFDEAYIASRLVTCLVAFASGVVFSLLSPLTTLQKLYLVLYVLFRVSEAGMDVLHGALQSAWRMDIAGKSLILRGAVELVLFAATLYFTASLTWALTTMMLFSMAWLFSYELLVTRKVCKIQISHLTQRATYTGLGQLFGACLPLLIGNLAYSLILYEPRFAIERIHGTSVLGVYASIAAPALLLPLLATYLFTPFLPKMADLFQENRTRELNRLHRKMLAGITALGLLVLLAVAALGHWALALLFGSEIAQESALLLPITGSVICTAYFYYMNAVLASIRRTSVLYFSSMIGVAACLVLSNSFVQQFGPNGASFALILVQALQVAFQIVYFEFAVHRSGEPGREG